jgi:hypothetical protein
MTLVPGPVPWLPRQAEANINILSRDGFDKKGPEQSGALLFKDASLEPAVRGARTESAIIRRGRAVVLCPKPQFLGCRAAVYHSKSSRRERNFWMRRLEAKNPPERPQYFF